MWKDTIKKGIFDKTPEEMTDFMNVTPRMKQEAEKRKGSKNNKSINDFVDDVVRNADRILGQYTEEYGIEDDDDLAIELRDVLKKIFISLVPDYIEKNPDL